MDICCKKTIHQVKDSALNKKEEEKGAYLIFDSASNGSLFIVWKKEKVKDALIYIKPIKSVPEFKFTNHNGKSELIRNLQSDKKLFYSGLCQFIKEARDIKGEVCLLPHIDESSPIKVDIYFLKGNNVELVKVGTPIFVHDVDAISILPRGSSSLMVKTMKKDMFVCRGHTEGASISF